MSSDEERGYEKTDYLDGMASGGGGTDAEDAEDITSTLLEAERVTPEVDEGQDPDETAADTNKEVVDPTELDWRRVWDDHPTIDSYKPLSGTKVALMIDCHREITPGVAPGEAVSRAIDSGQLVERGHRLAPKEAR